MTADTYYDVDRVRVGRNYVRVGDTVHVKPSRPHKRDGFDSEVTRIQLLRGHPDDVPVSDPQYAQVTVRQPRNGSSRTFFLDRIERRAQTKARA